MNRYHYLPFLLLIGLVSSEEENNTYFELDSACYQLIYLFNQTYDLQEFVVTKMRVLQSENTVYYAFKALYGDDELTSIGHVNLDYPQKEGFITYDDDTDTALTCYTLDIDQLLSVVYIGGETGIFTYDKYGVLKSYGAKGDKITSLSFAESVYFVKEGDSNIYVLLEGDWYAVAPKAPTVKDFIATDNGYVLFLNENGLFVIYGRKTIFLLASPLTGLAVNLDGIVYVWYCNRIFKIIVDTTLQQFHAKDVGSLSSDFCIDAMAFDENNDIIFVQQRNFFKLMRVVRNVCK